VQCTYLTSHAIARIVSVSPSTVLAWIDRGLLPAYRTPGGHRRVERGALIRFLREHRMPVPTELAPLSRLLVIDDEDSFLRAVKRELERSAPEIDVETADGALDGLLKVVTFMPDAVLLDTYMPGLDGLEVCRRLRTSNATAHIRVIAISGRPSPELEIAYRKAGAAAYLSKPLDVQALLGALALRPRHGSVQ
jgi:excisionase family DNA binding protein